MQEKHTILTEGIPAFIIFFDLPSIYSVSGIQRAKTSREDIPLLVNALQSEIYAKNQVICIEGILLLTREELSEAIAEELRNQNVFILNHRVENPFPSLLEIMHNGFFRPFKGEKALLVSVQGSEVTKSLMTISENKQKVLSTVDTIELNNGFIGEKKNKLRDYINLKIIRSSRVEANIIPMNAEEREYSNFCIACFKGLSLPPIPAYCKASIEKYGFSPVDYAIRGGHEALARQLVEQLGMTLTPYQACLLTAKAKETIILLDWHNIHVAQKDIGLFLQAIKQFAASCGRDYQLKITVFLNIIKLSALANDLIEEGGPQLQILNMDSTKSSAADSYIADYLRDNITPYQNIILVSGSRNFSSHLSYYSQRGCPIYLLYNEQAWHSFKFNPRWTASLDYLDLPDLALIKTIRKERLLAKQTQRKGTQSVNNAPESETRRELRSKPCQFFQEDACKHEASACNFLHRCNRCHDLGAIEEHPAKACYRPSFEGFVLEHPYIDFSWKGWKAIKAILSPVASSEESSILLALKNGLDLFYELSPGLAPYRLPQLNVASRARVAGVLKTLIRELYSDSSEEDVLARWGLREARVDIRVPMVVQLMNPLSDEWPMNPAYDAFHQAQMLKQRQLPPLSLLVLSVLYTLYANICSEIGNKLPAIYAINMAYACLTPAVLGAECNPQRIEFLFNSFEMKALRSQVRYNQLLICTDDFADLHRSYNKTKRLIEHSALHQLIEQFIGDGDSRGLAHEVRTLQWTGDDSIYFATILNRMLAITALPRLEVNVRKALNQLQLLNISENQSSPPRQRLQPQAPSIFPSYGVPSMPLLPTPTSPQPQKIKSSSFSMSPVASRQSPQPVASASAAFFDPAAEVQQDVPQCPMCESRPRDRVKGKLKPFCSRSCMKVFVVNNAMCLECGVEPRFVTETGKSEIFCSITCVQKNQVMINEPVELPIATSYPELEKMISEEAQKSLLPTTLPVQMPQALHFDAITSAQSQNQSSPPRQRLQPQDLSFFPSSVLPSLPLLPTPTSPQPPPPQIKSSFVSMSPVASSQSPQPVVSSAAAAFFEPAAEVQQDVPQCPMCESRPRYLEKGKLQPFCSRACKKVFVVNSAMCLECEVVPRFVTETGQSLVFCSTTCTHKNQVVINNPVEPLRATSYPEPEKMISAEAQKSLLPTTLPVQMPQALHFDAMTPAQIKDWVFGQHALLQPFAPLFESNVVTGHIFLNLTDEDLCEIGIDNDLARQLILSCIQKVLDEKMRFLIPDMERPQQPFDAMTPAQSENQSSPPRQHLQPQAPFFFPSYVVSPTPGSPQPPIASSPELGKKISAEAQKSLLPTTLPAQMPQALPFDAMTPAQIKDWVFGQHALLQPFAPLFESNVVTGHIFLNLTDEDLCEIGIDNDLARQLILSCIQKVLDEEVQSLTPDIERQQQPFDAMTPAQMKDWVFGQHALLQPFAPLFESNVVTGHIFLNLTDEDLCEIGIDNDLARQLILSCIQHAVNGPTLRLCAEEPLGSRPFG